MTYYSQFFKRSYLADLLHSFPFKRFHHHSLFCISTLRRFIYPSNWIIRLFWLIVLNSFMSWVSPHWNAFILSSVPWRSCYKLQVITSFHLSLWHIQRLVLVGEFHASSSLYPLFLPWFSHLQVFLSFITCDHFKQLSNGVPLLSYVHSCHRLQDSQLQTFPQGS